MGEYKAFSIQEQNILIRWLYRRVMGWNPQKYFARRDKVIRREGNILLRLYYLFWVKRTDARKGCSFGTLWGRGATFASLPDLPHGPNGIIVGWDARIGKNVTIFHHKKSRLH